MPHALETAGAIPDFVHARCLGMSVPLPSLKRNAVPAPATPADGVTRTIPLRRFWWAAILLLGISGSAVGWTIWKLRTDSIDAAVSESGNIATILAVQLSRSIQAIDAVLLEVKRSAKGQDIDTPLGIHASFENQAFFESLLEYRTRVPQAFNIAIADKDGQIVVSTAGWPTPNIQVADRDYFKDARARTDQLHASVQAKNRVDGTRTI